jgi:adenylate cyclase
MPSARRLHLMVGIVLLMVLATARLTDPGFVRDMRALYFDRLQQAFPRPAADLPVRVIDIDEASLARLGQWPWPRNRLAAMVDRLSELGVAAIAFDVIFAEADRLSPARLVEDPEIARLLSGEGMRLPDHDAAFAAAMQGRGVVLGTAEVGDGGVAAPPRLPGMVEVGMAPGSGLPAARSLTPVLPVLAEASAGIGSISTSPTGSPTVIRTVPLLWRTEGGLLPTLALEALRVALGETTYVLIGSSAEVGLVEALRIGPFEIPTTPEGELRLHYRWDDRAIYVPAHALFAEPVPADLGALLEGTIVLVGTSAPGLLDIRTTALGEAVPGVSIHAQLLEQVLTGDYLRRPAVFDALEVLGLLVVGLLLIATMATLGPVASLLAGGGFGGLALGTSLYGFLAHRVLLDATFPLLGGLVLFLVMLLLRYSFADRERRKIRRSFSQYVSRDVLDVIERSGHRLELGGDMQTVTVMFADIRNFTSRSERMSATALVGLLNELFTDLGEAILTQQGTIDKFIGDAIMAFWNAPLRVPDHRLRACRGALGMRAALQAFNARKGWDEAEAVALAIGLSAGPACVGNIGSRSRFNYSVIGDTVNAAARIETACRHVAYDILMSGTVAADAGVARLAILPAGALELKGKAERLPSFILVGDEDLASSPDFRALAAAHAALIEAMAAAERGCADRLALCTELSLRVDPALAAFYGRIASRHEDFRVIRDLLPA